MIIFQQPSCCHEPDPLSSLYTEDCQVHLQPHISSLSFHLNFSLYAVLLRNLLPPFCSRTALMSLYCRRINAEIFIIRIFFQMLEYFKKCPLITPFAETWINCLPWTKTLRKIPPGCSTAYNPENGIKYQASLPGRPVLALENISFILFHCSSDISYLLCIMKTSCVFLLL